MEETTALALLHRGKLQRIHDAPPDSTTGLLQHVRMLSAASGKNWKNMELDKRGKNKQKQTISKNSFVLLPHPPSTFGNDLVS